MVWISNEQCLLVACDSCGAVGGKEADVIQTTPELAARLITRNALLEILSVGGNPLIITATVANELNPTGNAILKGIKKELALLKTESLPISISIEKNFRTLQTGFGITVVGTGTKSNLRIGTSQQGDWIYCLGIPKIGQDILNLNEHQFIQYPLIQTLLSDTRIHDIIPVGSKGIHGEASELAKSVGSRFVLKQPPSIAPYQAAGPCTCLLFASKTSFDDLFFERIPLSKIGCLSLTD